MHNELFEGLSDVMVGVPTLVLSDAKEIADELVEEARVQQMHDCVFHPANVDVHWHPFLYLLRVCELILVEGVQETKKVPG